MLDPYHSVSSALRAGRNCGCRLAFLSAVLFPLWLTTCPNLSAQAATNSLEDRFRAPPPSTRPWVQWFWMDGNISREGITADLEAMQRAGIGGLLLMDITQEIPQGPVPFLGAEWRELFKHTVREAGRLGLKVSMNNDPGWCGSGGPWITPELAMQRLVYSLTNVGGPARLEIQLPKLPAWNGAVWDVATLAFPTLVGDGMPVPGVKPDITANPGGALDIGKLTDREPATFVALPKPSPGKALTLLLSYDQPFRADQLTLTIKQARSIRGRLQASSDGRKFEPIREFAVTGNELTLQFVAVTGRCFRVEISSVDTAASRLELAELQLAPVYRIEAHPAKAGMAKHTRFQWPASEAPTYATIPLNQVVDLTAMTDTSGRLTWSVPNGQWTVCRFGHMPTGRHNPPARAEGYGLECDKLSQKAIEAHFDGMLARLIADNLAATGSVLTATHIDSWEVGFQNWTPLFRQEFERLRGYDPLKYLPAFTGRIVESLEVSERFLWDVRRTIADLVATNYAGHLRELAQRHGLELSAEAYGNGPFDNLLYASRVDVPMSEFWNETDDYPKFHTSKSMASVAHVYGKPIVAAEAFTAWPDTGKWQNHPFTLKKLADTAFVYGVNRIVFVRFAHQPWLRLAPGMTMGHWGIHYERTQTWWDFSKPWHEYLARCQFLLQSGRFVADVLYLTDEGAYNEPPLRDSLSPALPPGYDYDLAPPDALSRIAVRDGSLLMPDGTSYRVLVLPQATRMTPGLLRRVRDLAAAGAVIVGAPPERSPSLSGFPQCDEEVRDLAARLWSRDAGSGKNRVFRGRTLTQVFGELNLPPDFKQENPTAQPLRYLHRRIGERDVYFVANPDKNSVTADCTFRVTGKKPEIWRPDTGETATAAIWRPTRDGTTVRLDFDPVGSLFVVFQPGPEDLDPIVGIKKQGVPDSTARVAWGAGTIELAATNSGAYELMLLSGKTIPVEIPTLPARVVVEGPWEVTFRPDLGAPSRITLDTLQPWNKHPDPGVRFFSGRATYHKTIEIPPAMLAPDRRLLLSLGRVAVISEVTLNGRSSGLLWKPPFIADITRAARPGENQLEVTVVNLWPNRLIGDEHLEDDCEWNEAVPGALGSRLVDWPKWMKERTPRPSRRVAFATRRFYTKNSPLLESGLLGPVVLFNEAATRVGGGSP